MTTDGEKKNLSRALDSLLQPWNQSDAPGLVIGVALAGAAVYRRGLGLASVEHGTANTPATRMRIGSTSKHFASLCALLLAEEGKLDLDVPVRRWLSELGGPSGEPSLRQLMQHVGGIRDPGDLPGLLLNGQWSTAVPYGSGLEVSGRFTDVSFPIGERMVYCNQGYYLLSLAVERVSGLPFGEFLRQRLLAPLDMNETQLLPSDMKMLPRLASLHVPQPDGSYRRGIYPSEELLGSGGMVSTIDDMLAWLKHLRAGDKRFGGEETWRQLLQRPRYGEGTEGAYCLGLIRETYRGAEIIHHSGGVIGGTCQMLTVPEHALDICLMFNRGDGAAPAVALKVIDAVLGDKLPPAPPPLQPEDHAALQGRWYEPRSHRVFGITAMPQPDNGKALALTIYDQPAGLLRAVEGGLRVSSAAHGPIELRLPPSASTAPETLEVIDCGRAARFQRLPEQGPALASLDAAIAGRYRYLELDKELELVLKDGALYLDLRPACGRFHFKLTPYTHEVFGCFPDASWALPVPAQALTGALTVERRDGAVAGLWLSSWRTRNLWLERCR